MNSVWLFSSFSVVDVFICGGYNGELILADLWKINLQSFQWSKLPAVMPEPAYFHCAAVTPVSTTQPFLITLYTYQSLLFGVAIHSRVLLCHICSKRPVRKWTAGSFLVHVAILFTLRFAILVKWPTKVANIQAVTPLLHIPLCSVFTLGRWWQSDASTSVLILHQL